MGIKVNSFELKESFGLDYEDISRMQEVFATYPVIKKVVVYGSRAMGNFKPYSDIDLTIMGNVSLSTLHEIETELDDLLLPYKIDISIFDKISNPDLIEHIDSVGKVFYKANL